MISLTYYNQSVPHFAAVLICQDLSVAVGLPFFFFTYKRENVNIYNEYVLREKKTWYRTLDTCQQGLKKIKALEWIMLSLIHK